MPVCRVKLDQTVLEKIPDEQSNYIAITFVKTSLRRSLYMRVCERSGALEKTDFGRFGSGKLTTLLVYVMCKVVTCADDLRALYYRIVNQRDDSRELRLDRNSIRMCIIVNLNYRKHWNYVINRADVTHLDVMTRPCQVKKKMKYTNLKKIM